MKFTPKINGCLKHQCERIMLKLMHWIHLFQLFQGRSRPITTISDVVDSIVEYEPARLPATSVASGNVSESYTSRSNWLRA